jgi:hypothetical protein
MITKAKIVIEYAVRLREIPGALMWALVSAWGIHTTTIF